MNQFLNNSTHSLQNRTTLQLNALTNLIALTQKSQIQATEDQIETQMAKIEVEGEDVDVES